MQQNQFQSTTATNPVQFPEHEHLNCPRCDSTNTKFCYYNNYNLLQPRHFCKNCRRYWTKGGTLRKIPIGGGTRKIAKRSSKSSPATPPPPSLLPSAELKPEQSDLFDLGNNQGQLRSNDEFAVNLSGGSETEGLNGAQPETAVLRRNMDGNDGGWTDLSIFTAGSKFH